MKINQKLLATFIPIVLIPLVLLQVVSWFFLSREINEKTKASIEKVEGVAQLLANSSNLNDYFSNLSYDMAEEAKVALDTFKSTVDNYFKQSGIYDHLLLFDASRKLLLQMDNKSEKLKIDPKQVYDTGAKLEKGKIEHLNYEDHLLLVTRCFNESDEMTGLLAVVLDQYQVVEIYKERMRMSFFTMAGITLVALVLVVFITIFIAKRITLPIIETNSILRDIAEGEGDLTRRLNVKTHDEIGELAGWFNKFADQIFRIILEVRDVSVAINNLADEIAAGSRDLHSSADQQHESISGTLKVLDQFLGIVRENSGNARDASSTLDGFNFEIQDKKHLVEDVTETMTEISQSGARIDNIINVINDISFQTNLLALNAAVEAARAGEAGRGFAVVAAEVRNLAQKTAESSKMIQEIVSSNVDSTQKGMELVNQTSVFFTSIFQVIRDIVDKTGDISKSSDAQLSGVQEINGSINSLDSSVGHLLQMVEKLSGSGGEMKNTASRLKKLVDIFKLHRDSGGEAE